MFDWEHGNAMQEMMGIEPLRRPFGMSHGISRVAVGRWVYSRVTAGMDIQNSTLFSEVRAPV